MQGACAATKLTIRSLAATRHLRQARVLNMHRKRFAYENWNSPPRLLFSCRPLHAP